MTALEAGLRYRLRRALRQISTQHGHLGEALRELGEAVAACDRETALAHFDRLFDAVEAHFALEDRVIFPGLQDLRPARGEELAELSEEHQRFVGELWRLRERIDDSNFAPCAKAFDVFRRAIRQHESREEQLVGEFVDDAHGD